MRVELVEVHDFEAPLAPHEANVAVQLEKFRHFVPGSLAFEQFGDTQESDPKPLEICLPHPDALRYVTPVLVLEKKCHLH
jgi:hypothetical protein